MSLLGLTLLFLSHRAGVAGSCAPKAHRLMLSRSLLKEFAARDRCHYHQTNQGTQPQFCKLLARCWCLPEVLVPLCMLYSQTFFESLRGLLWSSPTIRLMRLRFDDSHCDVLSGRPILRGWVSRLGLRRPFSFLPPDSVCEGRFLLFCLDC